MPADGRVLGRPHRPTVGVSELGYFWAGEVGAVEADGQPGAAVEVEDEAEIEELVNVGQRGTDELDEREQRIVYSIIVDAHTGGAGSRVACLLGRHHAVPVHCPVRDGAGHFAVACR